MKTIISGGSGLIGRALAASLLQDGHEVWVLTRRANSQGLPQGAHSVQWDGRTTRGWQQVVDGADVVVNLAGESLGAGRWSAERKQRILTSRLWAGEALTRAVEMAEKRPRLFLQASAVGYYGTSFEEAFDENSPPGADFLSGVCREWEESTRGVEGMGVRRALLRNGLVLARTGGVLDRLALPVRWFAGGPLGSGRQWVPWIHLEDEVGAMRFLMEQPDAGGAYNLAAPEALRQVDFTRALAKEMRRPYWLPAPAFALRLLLGEMSTLVLDGQNVRPRRLLDAGYVFRFPALQACLQDLLK